MHKPVNIAKKKTDFHVHVTPPDIAANPGKYEYSEPYFYELSQSKHNKFAAAEDVIAALENAQFDHAVIFGFGFRDLGLCRYVNDYVIEKVKQYPGKLTGFIAVPPVGSVTEVQRCYDEGLRGIGELFVQDCDLESPAASFTSIIKEMNLPLIIHVNEPVGHYYAGKREISLNAVEKFVCANQGLKIILAHWGGGLFVYEAMPEIREKFRDVYYDTAATPFLYDSKIYNAAKALNLCDKILFGSDFPLLPQTRYMDAIHKSDLTEAEIDMIMSTNAQKLLSGVWHCQTE